jgi:hypothetical protein
MFHFLGGGSFSLTEVLSDRPPLVSSGVLRAFHLESMAMLENYQDEGS